VKFGDKFVSLRRVYELV